LTGIRNLPYTLGGSGSKRCRIRRFQSPLAPCSRVADAPLEKLNIEGRHLEV